jgi:maltose/moltooligosaccharide transporter
MTDSSAYTPEPGTPPASAPPASAPPVGAPHLPTRTAPLHQPRLPFGRALLYSSGNFGAGIFYAFNNFILSLYLNSLGAPAVLLGPLSNTRSAEGAIIQPLVGAWSDRTWNRLGRRRPFIVAFVPISALFLVVTAFVPRFQASGHVFGLRPQMFTLTLVSVGIFLFTVTFNIMVDPYTALLADITPVRQRGNVNGIFQMVGAAGQMGVLLLSVFLFGAVSSGQGYFTLFLLTAGALILSFVPTVLGVREPRTLVDKAVPRRYTLRDYWLALRGERQVQLYFAVQFFLWFGISAITPFLTIYAKVVIGLNNSGALLLSFILLASTALFNWPAGALADRLGLKRVFLVGMILLAGASIVGIFIRAPLLLYITLGVAGIGNAAQTGSSYPLLTRLVRPDRMGLYTGLNSTLTSIAAPVSGLIAGLVITAYGYTFMFPFVAAMFLLSLIPLAFLDLAKGEAHVRAELEAA